MITQFANPSFAHSSYSILSPVTFETHLAQSGFRVITKLTSANLGKPIHGIKNYSTFICPFESENCGKQGKKLQKFEYLEKKKSFLDEIKFSVFEGLSFGEKKSGRKL